MSYLTIIAIVWATCAACAVFFIRGATARDLRPAPVRIAEPTLGQVEEFSRTV
jgi:hypothetical protein